MTSAPDTSRLSAVSHGCGRDWRLADIGRKGREPEADPASDRLDLGYERGGRSLSGEDPKRAYWHCQIGPRSPAGSDCRGAAPADARFKARARMLIFR